MTPQQIGRSVDAQSLHAFLRALPPRLSWWRRLQRWLLWRIPQTAFVVTLLGALVWWAVG